MSQGDSNAAFDAVVRYAERQEPGLVARRLRRDRVVLALVDERSRGGEVLARCGPSVAGRTLVVYTTRTDLLPSASLSEGDYFVSREEGILTVWKQAH
ncbi:MAG TPA: hypothetical protein VNG13_00940 [Mycobacteriales bacterium]|nr:hypothetical protein [Mycobacteriales bacterium]